MMSSEKSISSDLYVEVAEYYSEKLAIYGETPQGVDWNAEAAQITRFEQLSKVFNKRNFSVNDLGCGYGALYQFLASKDYSFSYTGIDIALSMINAAEKRYMDQSNARFICASEPKALADYSVASGIFNVRLNRSDNEWEEYIVATIDVLDRTSVLGFSFNCLSSYSDADKMRANLYYSDPCKLFDLCKRRFSKNVALLHDYGLYEFTIVVNKIL